MLLELPAELLTEVLTYLAFDITFSSIDQPVGAHPDTQILRTCRYLREETTPLILQHATYYISARTFSKLFDQHRDRRTKEKPGREIHHIMVPPVVADLLFDGLPYGGKLGHRLPSVLVNLQTLEIDHRMCGCRSNSLIERMHAQDCTSLIFSQHWPEHLEFAIRGFTNDYYQSYMQKCLLVHRKELSRYFGWVRGPGVDVRVKMMISKGRFEECRLWVGRKGVEVVRDEGNCVDEAMEWFQKLFDLSRVK